MIQAYVKFQEFTQAYERLEEFLSFAELPNSNLQPNA